MLGCCHDDKQNSRILVSAILYSNTVKPEIYTCYALYKQNMISSVYIPPYKETVRDKSVDMGQ